MTCFTTACFSSRSASAAPGQVGVNFWFRADWGEVGSNKTWKPGANFATDSNPFNQTFLDEIEPFSTLRMMEWNPTNHSTEKDWSDRRQKADPVQQGNPGEADNYDKVLAGTGGTPTKGVAYEWQIKLCNLKNANYWVNIPHRATDDYMRQLARLIRDNLNSNLKVYVEYSNELWFGQRQSDYAKQQGQNLGLAAKINDVESGVPTDNRNTQGYYVYRSLQMFKIFNEEFGGNSGRVKKVLAGLVHDGWSMQIWKSVLTKSDLNPHNLKPDYVATSFYPGISIDGAASDALQQLYNDEARAFNVIKQAKTNATNYFGVPLIMYEGGYSVFTNAGVLAANSGIYDWQKKFMDDASTVFDLMMLYSYTDSGATYGLKKYIGQPNSETPRYRAATEWISSHGGNGKTGGGSTPTPTPTPSSTPTPTPSSTPASSDSVSGLTAPASISAGSTATLTVKYSATTSRRVHALLLNPNNNWSNHGSTIVNVSSGSGTLTINVSVSSSTPAGSAYSWQVWLESTSGSYITGTSKDNISVTTGTTPDKDVLSSISGSSSVKAGNTVGVSVSYSATTARKIEVALKNPSNNWSYHGGATVNVTAGSGTVTVNVPVSSNTAAGNTYVWQARLLNTSNGFIADKTQSNITVTK